MKKTIHSIIAVAAAIGLIGFVSCNDKEEKEQTNNNDSGVKAEYTFWVKSVRSLAIEKISLIM